MSTYSIPLFLIITTSLLLISQAADTLHNSQIFTDNGTTLISSGGTFELGFFSPSNSNNRFIGIWYKKITVRTIVWVANTDFPLTDKSGALKVVEPGLLVLVNSTNTIMWSTNTSRNVINPIARLLDSGNLIVKDAGDKDNNPDSFVWQNFHYPTDTLLPGMKHGWNFTTGLEVYLRSWRRNDDPSSGDFSFHCDPNGYPQCVIKKGDSVQYKPGPWNGVSYSGIPTLQKNTIFTFEMVINSKDVFFRFELVNDSVFTRFTLNENGVGQQLVWVERRQEWISYLTMPLDNCDVYDACGPYGSCNIRNSPACGCLDKFEPKDPQARDRGDWSNGCVRRTPLDCAKGDGFLKYSGMKLPDTKHSWYNQSMSLVECKFLCSRNCSCTAYASLDIRSGEHGCLLWFEELVDIREISPGQNIYIRIAASELDSKGKKREILIVTLSLAIGIVLISLGLFVYFLRRRKLEKRKETALLGLNYPENHDDLELPLFPLSTITKATDNFSLNNKLGEGGFGPVYKGLLEEGQEIAVKCLSRTSHQGVEEFKNEVICIAKLQHRNLVRLLGWCIHGEELMLVYEYVPNKSLDLILFNQVKSTLLDWPTRFNIINSIARGLMYLHQDSRLRVIHRDLKASNILLDSDMNPKISDFGLARTLGGNQTGDNTRRVVGTYGYMSPEYATHGLFSVKSDVFSFGVLVLEIITGKRNRVFSHNDHHLDLLGHTWMLYREGKSSELVDSCFRDSCNLSEVVRSIHIGLLCVQERPEDRPSMSSVVQMLGNDNVLPESKYPGFFTGKDEVQNENSSNNTACSTNPMSITLLEPR